MSSGGFDDRSSTGVACLVVLVLALVCLAAWALLIAGVIAAAS